MAAIIKITSEEKDKEILLNVIDVLKSISGSFFTFIPLTRKKNISKNKLDKEQEIIFLNDLPDKEFLLMDDFFYSLNLLRSKSDLGNESEILIFLTSRRIAGNTFNGIDFENKNIFIDLNGWNTLFLKGSPIKYSISFMTFISICLLHYFKNQAVAGAAIHKTDRGCILDLNKDKEKVDLKILTARICPECIDKMKELIPDDNLLSYFRAGLEKIRRDIIEGEYYSKIKPKKVKVFLEPAPQKKSGYKISFEGIGDLELDNAHLTVYLYFLQKKEPVLLDNIYKDYYFLFELYKFFDSHNKLEINESKIEKMIQKICRIKKEGDVFKRVKSNTISERFNEINTSITKVLGTFGLELNYQIFQSINSRGVKGGHKIKAQEYFEDKTSISRNNFGILEKSPGLLDKIYLKVKNKTITLQEK